MPDILQIGLFFAAAFLYTSVGHGGASAYLGILALYHFSPDTARFFALVLNLAASGITAGFRWRAERPDFMLLVPLLAASVPAAYFGSTFTLGVLPFKVLAAAILLYSATRLWITPRESSDTTIKHLPVWVLIAAGTAIGFVSGLIGIGGGIFLSPLLLFTHAASFRQTALLSSLFIFANSASGLLGATQPGFNHMQLGVLLGSVVVGSIAGTLFSFQSERKNLVRRFLATAIGIAGIKILWQLIG